MYTLVDDEYCRYGVDNSLDKTKERKMTEKTSAMGERRSFKVSSESLKREKELLEKYEVEDIIALLIKMESRARCHADLLERIEPADTLPPSCITHFGEEFNTLADALLGISEVVYGSGLASMPQASDEEDT